MSKIEPFERHLLVIVVVRKNLVKLLINIKINLKNLYLRKKPKRRPMTNQISRKLGVHQLPSYCEFYVVEIKSSGA